MYSSSSLAVLSLFGTGATSNFAEYNFTQLITLCRFFSKSDRWHCNDFLQHTCKQPAFSFCGPPIVIWVRCGDPFTLATLIPLTPRTVETHPALLSFMNYNSDISYFFFYPRSFDFKYSPQKSFSTVSQPSLGNLTVSICTLQMQSSESTPNYINWRQPK